MNLLETLIVRAEAMDAASFDQEYEGFYLLGRFPSLAQKSMPFTTQVRNFDTSHQIQPVSEDDPSAPGKRDLWRVEKSDRNAWKRRISVGRATNNDIIIRHHSVSKLHAHFHFGHQAGTEEQPPAEYTLVDVGSSNGTLVNSQRLAEGVPVPVYSGDQIIFGGIACGLFNARRLHGVLLVLSASPTQ